MTLITSEPELLLDGQCTLGEGPVWNDKTNQLHWVDILEKRIHTLNLTDHTQSTLQFDQTIGCVGLSDKGNFVVGQKYELSLFTPNGNLLKHLFKAPTDHPANRFNDGKCSPEGRFVVGSMDMNEKEPNGSLYCIDQNGRSQILIDRATISNGITWSPDHKKMYYIDTPTKEVQVFDYDLSTGSISNGRCLIRIPESMGYPDGMTSDTEGRLYISMWAGHSITIWDGSDGTYLQKIEVPALNTTCCVFGGDGLSDLYITSARVGMNDADLKKYPLSGGIFKVQTNAHGLEIFKYRE